MIKKIQKTREYLDYLEKHYNNVQKAWKLLQERCSDMRFITDDYVFHSIAFAVKNHDESKLSSEEFTQYREYFFPVDDEEKDESAFDKAWEHHKKHNRHHWETWVESQHPVFDDIDIVHNIVDWVAMSMHYGGTAEEYYVENKLGANMTVDSAEFIQMIFAKLKVEEEEAGE